MKKFYFFLLSILLLPTLFFSNEINLFFNNADTNYCKNIFSSNESSPSNNENYENNLFELNFITDSILISTGAILNGIWLVNDKILKNDIPTTPFTPGNIENINNFDRNFAYKYSKNLDIISDITLGLTVTFPLILLKENNQEKIKIFSMYAETLLLTNGIKEIGKVAFSRLRPYGYFSEYPENKYFEGDFFNSFPSGHTAFAFASATFVSYVFSKYNPDSNWKYVVISSSYSLALTTQILRVKSGSHFLSDVLTGAAIGTLCGFFVPWLHTKNFFKNKNITITPTSLYFTHKF